MGNTKNVKKTYEPKPYQGQSVLPSEILIHIDMLAKNLHDKWSLQRIEGGWQYDSKRDDKLKTNPCLVPYEDLPEDEKDIEKGKVENVLRHLISLGFDISKID